MGKITKGMIVAGAVMAAPDWIRVVFEDDKKAYARSAVENNKAATGLIVGGMTYELWPSIKKLIK